MKVLLAIWLLSAGTGVSYSVISERKNQLECLDIMGQDMRKMAYFMCDWRMPVEEAVRQMIKESGRFRSFYEMIHNKIIGKHVNDFGVLWSEESTNFLKNIKLSEDIKILWQDCFLHMPLEPEAVKRQLYLKSEMLSEKKEALGAKYKGEQRLVLSMGFFVSAFLCLILW